MNSNLETVVGLQQAILQIREAEQRLHGIPDWMRELHDEHAASKAEIDDLEQAVEEAAKDRRAAEAAVEDAQEKLRKYQQQINRVSTQREYGALLQEIDTVKAQIAGFEEQAFSSLERHDQKQKELQEKRDGFRELADRYAAELARWESEKPAIAQQVSALGDQIETLRGKLPRTMLAQFERILERNPAGALAPVRLIEGPRRGPREWHCGVCNYRVRPQVVVEISNGESLVQCDSCKRILYLGEAPA
ncbi:MAG TPA: C4-type zinc ribbon domain-containing protein [Thermoanaerobaculia bacterium]|nr:C4-type zinc ribbon domain-containing protein [Thermoanaerobaculia bacterium]